MIQAQQTFTYIFLATVLVLLVFPYETQAGTIARPTNNLGLVGYWDFDTGKFGDTAYDRSGNGNDGTLTNMDASTDWVDGQINQGLDFDGSDDHVDVGNDSSLNPATAITVSAWIKPGNPSAEWNLIATKWDDDGGTNDKFFYHFSLHNGKTSIYISADGQNAGSELALGPTALNQDTWYHVAFTAHTTTDEVKLYRDGAQDGPTGSYTASSFPSISQPTEIGTKDNGVFYFDGVIDDVRIYDRALSEGEIRRLYNLGRSKGPKVGATPTAVADGLVGHWTFDGPNLLENAADSSGQDNVGYLTNFSSTTTVPGRIGQALEFDGVDDEVAIKQSIPSQAGSASAWVKPNFSFDAPCTGYEFIEGTVSGNNFRVGYNSCSSFRRFTVFFTGGFGANCERKAEPIFTNNAEFQKWHHVVATYDLSVDSVKVYVDGMLGADTTCTTNDFTISAFNIGNSEWDGKIDDVRLYDRVLSANEVQRLYNIGSVSKVAKTHTNHLNDGLVGHWTFDGPNLLENATDSSGQDNAGYLTNFSSTTTVPGRIGQALEFDGSDDSVIIADSSELDVSGALTIALWVKGDMDKASWQELVFKGSNVNRHYFLRPKNGAGNVQFAYNGDVVRVESTTALTDDDTWYHIVATHDSSEDRIYINGVLDASASVTTNPTTGTESLAFGRLGDSSAEHFDGSLDDVRIYNRALSAGEVNQLYNMGR